MPKKKTTKETNKFDQVQKLTNDMLVHMKDLKHKYDRLDPKKKKQLITGIAGLTAILAGGIAARKIIKRKKG